MPEILMARCGMCENVLRVVRIIAADVDRTVSLSFCGDCLQRMLLLLQEAGNA